MRAIGTRGAAWRATETKATSKLRLVRSAGSKHWCVGAVVGKVEQVDGGILQVNEVVGKGVRSARR